MSAAFVSHWVCNVAVGQSFMSAVQLYGLAPVYTFFGVMALAGSVYVTSQVGGGAAEAGSAGGYSAGPWTWKVLRGATIGSAWGHRPS